mgnify:CR=1 FL=1
MRKLVVITAVAIVAIVAAEIFIPQALGYYVYYPRSAVDELKHQVATYKVKVRLAYLAGLVGGCIRASYSSAYAACQLASSGRWGDAVGLLREGSREVSTLKHLLSRVDKLLGMEGAEDVKPEITALSGKALAYVEEYEEFVKAFNNTDLGACREAISRLKVLRDEAVEIAVRVA